MTYHTMVVPTLSEKALVEALNSLWEHSEPYERITIKPTKLLVSPLYVGQARRILFYKPPIGRAPASPRRRKLAIYWRKR